METGIGEISRLAIPIYLGNYLLRRMPEVEH